MVKKQTSVYYFFFTLLRIFINLDLNSCNYFLMKYITKYTYYTFTDFKESKEERMVITIGEIIQELLKAHYNNRDVDLNKLKTRISAKYGLNSSPRLVDIIAAVPSDVRNILVPKLKAKPIRTASGVSLLFIVYQ